MLKWKLSCTQRHHWYVVGVNKGRTSTRGTRGSWRKEWTRMGEGTNEWAHLIVKLTFVWARGICQRTAEEYNCHSSMDSTCQQYLTLLKNFMQKIHGFKNLTWDIRRTMWICSLLITYGPHVFALRGIGFYNLYYCFWTIDYDVQFRRNI